LWVLHDGGVALVATDAGLSAFRTRSGRRVPISGGAAIDVDALDACGDDWMVLATDGELELFELERHRNKTERRRGHTGR
jgi:hypothetical protein